ncbi:MAG: molybdopterin-dependent oxidoreductase [Nannocystis sp.]|nr:molybdopterin-dependent oxidoreductase [Nannocystis sp.]
MAQKSGWDPGGLRAAGVGGLRLGEGVERGGVPVPKGARWFWSNNVDHCTRLCHASSVAALMETIGSGAVSTTFRDVENSDVALLVGTNTTSNRLVAATFFGRRRSGGAS